MSALWGLAQVVLLLAAAIGYGGMATFWPRSSETKIESLVNRLAIGLGLTIMATVAAGWLHFWGPWFHHGLLAGGIILLFMKSPNFQFCPPSLFGRRVLIWAAPAMAVLFFYATFPPTFYDALLYHLGIPGYYLQTGGFAPWPENVFSALPQNAEMLNLLLLSGGSVHGPKWLSLAAALVLVFYLVDWGRERNLRYPWLPALIFFSIPEIAFLAVTEKNDMLMMLFLLLGVRQLARLQEKDHWLTYVRAGIFLGLAAGVKWQGLLYSAAFVATYFLTSRISWRKRFSHAVLIGLIIILTIVPWLAKNQAEFGNPIHPYLSGIFASNSEAHEQARQIQAGVRRGQGFSPGAILSFCRRMFLQPYSLGLTHMTGVLVLLLLPMLFFKVALPGRGFLLAGCAIGFVLLLAASRVPRYFLPLFMVISLPLAAGWEGMEGKFPRFRRLSLLLLFSLVFIQAIQAVSLLERMTLGGRFVWGKWRGSLPPRARYLDVIPYYPAVAYINHVLPPGARIAFIGEERTFYLKRPFLCASSFDANPVLADFVASADTATWAGKLRRRGITHVLYCPRGLERIKRNSSAQDISAAKDRQLTEALRQLPKIFDDGRYSLYQIDNCGRSSPPPNH